MAKYEFADPGEWFKPVHDGYKIICCDCGLVHEFQFRVIEGQIEMRAFRDNRSTGQVRRHNNITVDTNPMRWRYKQRRDHGNNGGTSK